MKRAIAVGTTLLGAAAFAYALSALGAATIHQAIARIGWGFATILLLSFIRETAKAAAWPLTFTGAHRLSLRDAFRARMAGEALTTLLPMGFVVGEPMKAHHVEDRMPFATAFAGLMLEFAFYGASLLLLAIGALILFVPNKLGVVGAIAALSILPFVKPVQRALRPVWQFTVVERQRACAIGALEAMYHALGCAETYIILGFLAPGTATWRAAAGFELVNRGITLVFKMVPLRVGVDEASAAFIATRLAIAPTTGVMLAVVRKLRVLFWTALGLLAIAVRAIERCVPALTYHVNELEKSA
jgi:hypothetical protein